MPVMTKPMGFSVTTHRFLSHNCGKLLIATVFWSLLSVLWGRIEVMLYANQDPAANYLELIDDVLARLEAGLPI